MRAHFPTPKRATPEDSFSESAADHGRFVLRFVSGSGILGVSRQHGANGALAR